MDFTKICNLFGGSILFDEYTADLDHAEEQINEFECTVSTEEGRVVSCLLQGLLSAAKGEFASSGTSFASALSRARATQDARLISRCETYDFLLFAIKAELPLPRFHDDTDGDWRRLTDAQTLAYNRKIRFIQNGSSAAVTELDRLERDVVSRLAQYLSDVRMAAFPHHPAYHRHDHDILFRIRIPFRSPMLNEAERLGLRALSRHMRRLNAEYLLAGGSEQGTQELEQLHQVCLQEGDLVGAASCQLVLGDNRLSLPFTSPIALNLSLMNGTSARLQQWHDSIEAGHRLAYNAGADQFYDRAFGLFRAARSVRGTAAVHFRRGCVALAEYLNGLRAPAMHGRLDTWRASARSHLGDALDLYHGNGGMVRLVSAHSIILRILVSCPPGPSQNPAEGAHGAVQDASEIGTWAKDNANAGVARFAGLLFLGAGRLLSGSPLNIIAASLCCACARSCCRAAEERILELHAIIQHAKLFQSYGNMDAARAHLDDGQSALRHVVVNYIDPVIQTAASDDCRATVTGIRACIINELDSVAYSIYAGNPRSRAWETLQGGLLSERHGPFSAASPPSQTSPPSTLNALLSSVVDIYMSSTDTTAVGTSPGTGYGVPPNSVRAAGPTEARTAGTANTTNEQRSIRSMLRQLLGESDAVRRIHQQYDEAIAEHRKALVVDNDWEGGQERLRRVLDALDQPGVPKSTELYSVRAAVLHNLGRHDVIRQWLPDAIPAVFGGRLPIASDYFPKLLPNASPDLQDMNRQLVRQHGERSLSLCFVAQDWELGATVLQKIQESVPGFLEKVLTDKGDSRWYNMVYIAAIEEHSGNLESSFRWLIKALDIIETSRSRLTDVADRRELLNVIQSAELFAGLARVSLRLSASPVPGRRLEGLQTDHWTYHGPTWADEALAFLEQGRARALLDLFTLEEPSQERYLEWLHDLRKQECDMRDGKITETGGAGHNSDLAAYVERLRSSLRQEMQSPSRAMILNQLHRPHFAADTGALYEAIPEDALAIHMNPSRDGVLVLYISSKGVELARPSSFTDQQMEAHVLQYVKLFKIKKGNMNSLPPRAKCQAPLEDLSDDILRPALRLIDSKSHLIFVPSQSLNKLPFSALLLHGEPLFMRKEVSMAPSLSVLQHLVRNRTREGTCPSRTPLRATVVYKAPTGPPEKRLECSAAAAIEIAGRLGCSPKQAHKLDLGAFKEAYTTSDLVVICTHGLWRPYKEKQPNNKEQPAGQRPRKAPLSAWESSIELQTNLPVLELVPLRSRAALVVFQACVSGVGESSLGNDVLGFAHSVLASGAGAFVGALWNVSDLASAMLMAFLFREVTATQAAAGGGASSTLAGCLRRAQMRLYRIDASTARAVLQDFRDACAGLDDRAFDRPGHKRKILSQLNGITPEEYDFSHPFFWAPFVLVGHGGQTLGNVASQHRHTAPTASQNPDALSFESGPMTPLREPAASQGPEEAPPPPLPPRPPPFPSDPATLPLRQRPHRRPVPPPTAPAAVSPTAAPSPQGPARFRGLGGYPPGSSPSFARYNVNPAGDGPSSSSTAPPAYNFSPSFSPSYGPAAPTATPAAQAAMSAQATSPESRPPQPEEKKHRSFFGAAVRQFAKVALLEPFMPGLSVALAPDSESRRPSVPNHQNQPAAPPPPAGTQPPPSFNNNPGQVIVNGVILGPAERLMLQAAVGPVRPGSFWYDSISGAYGAAGGPCIGFLPGPAPALGGGPLAPDASGRTGTGVFVNGRELHGLDVAALQRIGAVVAPGRWWVRADGSYGAEGSSLVLGNLRMQAAYNAGAGGGGRAHSWSTSLGNYGGSDGQGFMYFGGPGWSTSNQ